MALARTDRRTPNRSITLIVASATLVSNVLSSLLFHQLPDDPFHLARNWGWYLHFANVLSVFGLIGAFREHALSITIFADYLILDTILCSIPRFLVLGLLRSSTSSLCSPSPSLSSYHPSAEATRYQTTISPLTSRTPDLPYPTGPWDSISSAWSMEGCVRIVTLAQWTLAVSVVAGTLLQFVGALYVREFARRLWIRECREEERFLRGMSWSGTEESGGDGMVEEREVGIGGLEVIDEVDEADEGSEGSEKM